MKSNLCQFFKLCFPVSACLLLVGNAWTQEATSQQQKPAATTPKEVAPDTEPDPILPVFKDGEAQIVEGFKKPADWIWHDLFVETEFDTDGSGTPDRMHVSVCRPKQTDTEGLKVPVIYETSPYYCGTNTTDKQYFWNPEQEVDTAPPERKIPPPIPTSPENEPSIAPMLRL